MKKNLISGVILLLPVAITIWVVVFLVDLLTDPFIEHAKNLINFFGLPKDKTLLIIICRIVILIVLFFFTLLLGFLGSRFIFRWLEKKINKVLMKIPLINSVYKACRDIVSAILSDKKKLISRVVVVPFPCNESRAIGLVTGNAPHAIQIKSQENHPDEVIKAVFIPTSPHPISGFLLLTQEKYLRPVDISLEDIFKFLISCGTFIPEEKHHEESHPIPSKDEPGKSKSPHVHRKETV